MICHKSLLNVCVLIICLAFSTSSFGAHPVVGGGSGKAGGPVNTVPGTTMGKGQWGLNLQMAVSTFDEYSNSELLEFAGADREIHNTKDITTYSISASTGITDHLTAHVNLPFSKQRGILESEPPDEVHEHGDSQGIGDISLHIHHMTVHLPSRGFHLAVLYGLKLPTGKSNDIDRNGERFSAEFQPGSGSWDPMLGVAITEDIGPYSFHGNVHYTLVNEGIQETDLGDRFNYNAAFVYRTRPPFRMNLFLELNGLWQDKEEVAGVKDTNSGGNLILLAPGVRFNITPGINAYLSYGFPVYQNLNGEQNEISNRFVAGLGMAL